MLVPHLICPASAMTCCRPHITEESILDAVIANVNLQLCWFLSDRYKLWFAVCYGTVVLSVCNVGVLWPNSWMDQNATWYGGRPWPTQHCVRWGPSSPHGKGHSSCPLPRFFVSIVAEGSPISATAELLLDIFWVTKESCSCVADRSTVIMHRSKDVFV